MRINKLIFVVLSLICSYGCLDNRHEKYIPVSFGEKKEYRDSLLAVYTAVAFRDSNFSTFGSYGFYSDKNDIIVSAERFFYDPLKLKCIAWVVFEISKDSECKLDISYNAIGLIGIRDSINSIWTFYPLLNRQAVCYSIKREAIESLEDYYYRYMKDHEMSYIVQSGSDKGSFTGLIYGYNLQDNDFWTKSLLWQRDTVGAFGLYQFQIKSYGYGAAGKTCIKCADAQKLPHIEYPKSIRDLYR